MKVEKALYAVVGAPVVGARKVGEQVDEIRSRLGKEATDISKTATARFERWAAEGEKLINRLTDAKVVDDIASRVDFDQVSTQVNKLRDQLEDLLATWRTSFRPEKLPTVKVEASTSGVKFDTIPSKDGKKPAKKAPAKTTTTKAKKVPATKKSTTTKATPRKAPAASKAS